MMIRQTTRSHRAFPAHRASPMATANVFAFLRHPVSAVSLMALLWSATPALVVAQADEEPQERPGLSRAALLEAARHAATSRAGPDLPMVSASPT